MIKLTEPIKNDAAVGIQLYLRSPDDGREWAITLGLVFKLADTKLLFLPDPCCAYNSGAMDYIVAPHIERLTHVLSDWVMARLKTGLPVTRRDPRT